MYRYYCYSLPVSGWASSVSCIISLVGQYYQKKQESCRTKTTQQPQKVDTINQNKYFTHTQDTVMSMVPEGGLITDAKAVIDTLVQYIEVKYM